MAKGIRRISALTGDDAVVARQLGASLAAEAESLKTRVESVAARPLGSPSSPVSIDGAGDPFAALEREIVALR